MKHKHVILRKIVGPATWLLTECRKKGAQVGIPMGGVMDVDSNPVCILAS